MKYVKCDGCDGCKPLMLEDGREENDFCGGTRFRSADGKSVKQRRTEQPPPGLTGGGDSRG